MYFSNIDKPVQYQRVQKVHGMARRLLQRIQDKRLQLLRYNEI